MTRAMRILPHPSTESPERRPSTPAAAGLILGAVWIAAVGALMVHRHHQAKQRRGLETAATARPASDIAREAINHLSAIRGYCEMTRIKAEPRYLDSAIETADEVVALLRKICKGASSGRP